MGADAKTSMKGVELTDAAASRITKILAKEPGKTVLIDDLSLVYLGGSVIDFVDDLMGQAFRITNPNAVASCGCGTSFSI